MSLLEFGPRIARPAPRPLGSVVIAHDYLTQRGGAERVALELAHGLGAQQIVTSVHDPAHTFAGFDAFDVATSRSAVLRVLRADVRRALPFLAQVWSQMPRVDADALVCSSSGWAHGLRVTPGTLKVVYCHNPARWLYQPADYTRDARMPVRTALRALTPSLRRWDARAAASADVYIANSASVAARIRRTYGIRAEVIHPPVAVDPDGAQEAMPGIEPGYFLTVARARGYKGTQRLIDAFEGLPGRRLVVVGLADGPELPANVTGVGVVSDAQLRWLYANACGLTSVSHEDFGLTPVEAAAFGTPALLLRGGGFLESTCEGVTGRFIDDERVDTIRTAVRAFPDTWDAAVLREHAASFSPEVFAARMTAAIERARARRVATAIP